MHPALTTAAAAAAKSLQSCPTLCDPIDSGPLGSPIPGILQAKTLEWVAISFSNTWKRKVKVKSLSRVWLFSTPWTAAYQAPPSMGVSRQEYWSGLPLPSPKYSADHLVWHSGIFHFPASLAVSLEAIWPSTGPWNVGRSDAWTFPSWLDSGIAGKSSRRVLYREANSSLDAGWWAYHQGTVTPGLRAARWPPDRGPSETLSRLQGIHSPCKSRERGCRALTGWVPVFPAAETTEWTGAEGQGCHCSWGL